ncbi:MAG TPA: PIN domain-containing protein [Jiangellales bacterium]|nr:PIN domain-containing protein [Jiangellales bacterium]
MIVLDAYAVLALLKGEPAAPVVRELLLSSDQVRLTAVGAAEVVDHLVRLSGAAEDDAALDLAQLGLAEALPVDAGVGIGAGLLRARHYHRQDRAVSLADCVAAEAARARGAPLASADPHLLDMCRDEGIAVLALPDGTGETWRP